jgi:hypothetical protein
MDWRNNKMYDFSQALILMKGDRKVARQGWNGKGMWIMLTHMGEAFEPFSKEVYPWLPFIVMKTVDDKFVPWLASQTDILAEDWVVV